MSDEEKVSKIMFVNRRAPHGSIYAYEGLEVKLIMGAFDQDLSAIFMDDAVLALKKGQDTSELGVKEFSATFRVLEDYGIEKVYVVEESLKERGLSLDELVIQPEVIPISKVAELMEQQDVLLSF